MDDDSSHQDNPSENTPLYLESEDHIYGYDDNQEHFDHEASLPNPNIQKFRLFHLVLAVTLFSCSQPIHGMVISQLVYSVFAQREIGNATINTRSDPCINSSSSNMSETALIHKVQDMTSQLTLYLDLTSNGLSIVTNLIFGVVSSKISSRTLLFIPTFGYFLRCIMVTFVCGLSLDVNWLFLAYTVDGLLGSQCGIYLATFLYTSDVTPRDRKRTLGVAIVETTKGVMGSAMNVVAGNLLIDTDFFISSVVVMVMVSITLVITFLLPDVRPKKLHPASIDSTVFDKLISPFTHGSPTTRSLVSLGVTAWFLCMLTSMGVSKFRDYYLMNLPFCFDTISIGWLEFTRQTAAQIFCVLAVIFLARRLPGMGMAILGVISQIASYFMYGLARTTAQVFIGPAISIGESLPVSVLRGETSRLLGSDQQGPLFAVLAVVESLAFTLAAPTFLPIYRSTQDFITGTGTAFFLAAILLVFLIINLAVYQVTWIRQQKELEYDVIVVQEKDDYETSTSH